MKCFALEQNQDNPLCPSCKHRRDCTEAMGHLANRINVDEALFRFMPTTLKPPEATDAIYDGDPSIRDIESVYVFCHRSVFGSKPRGKVGIYRDSIIAQAREAGVSVKLFFLANMLGWDQSHSDRPFYAQTLTSNFAVNQVIVFGKTCRERYGTFDLTSLDMLMGTDTAKKDLDSIMLNSEVITGAWIVTYKIFHEGDMCAKLYAETELLLHPSWLAIEQTYYETVLVPHMQQPTGSEKVQSHRWNVIHTIRELKRSNRMVDARTLFRKREEIMPQAVRQVLGMRNFRPEHFQVEDVPVVNALKFWARLGVAVQHFECLNFVDKIPSALDAYLAARRIGSEQVR